MRRRAPETEIHLDPVQAYDGLAREFARLSDAKRPYLSSIEQLVISHIPRGSRSLLDVGAGDGARALRIAQAAGITDLVLLEPSTGMRGKWPAGLTGWAIRAEELSTKNGSFDVITCLWNVLGHIFPQKSRIEVMRHCARLLAPEGRLFVDLNYRYNALWYGFLPTSLRILRDLARPHTENGNVKLRWQLDGTPCATDGHVFTDRELSQMAHSAGLAIEYRFSVNYRTGLVHQWKFAGNPLYVLRRAASGVSKT